MRLYNTLTRKIKKFTPLNSPSVTLYTCGPTVYDFTHLGHMRTYVNDDILRRVLEYFDYKVDHVMNITDVGHLTGDDDQGNDKLEKGAKKTGKTVWEVAKFYTKFFFETMDSLNILRPSTTLKATDCIQDMIKLNKQIEKNGYAYQTKEALYFDVKKFKKYGILSRQKLEDKIEQSRQEVYLDKKKHNPADFALWFKRTGRFKNHIMHWPSPWGDGFPGWHIECSAMSMKKLGKTIDIHAGGVDHIPLHHENEIAQSESATGKQFVRFWFHNNFLNVDGEKMSKSKGNFYTIKDVRKKGINPLSLRLLFMQTHYRQEMNFTWKAAQGADNAYKKLKKIIFQLIKKGGDTRTISEKGKQALGKIENFFADDLQTAKALATIWSMLKSDLSSSDKLNILLKIDKILGLNLGKLKKEKIPQKIIRLAEKRQKTRIQKKFKKSDELRKKIEEEGYLVEDKGENFVVRKK